ncbi:MAG: DUF4870 domain-containing protein [Clostridia bacterium]|nr:DUF4870 domain-containing protein [Clostridia bacterium]
MANSDDKIFAAISHLAIIFDLVGLIIAVLIYVLKGKESPFIGFTAKQAIGWQVSALITQKVLVFLTVGTFIGGVRMGMHPLGGFLGIFSLAGLVGLAFFVVAIIAAVKALNGEEYLYPVIGNFVAKI